MALVDGDPKMQEDDDDQLGDYIPPAPLFGDLKAAKVYHDRIKRPPGLKFTDTLVLLLTQVVLLVLYGLFVTQEKVPKQPYPDPGPADRPGMIDLVVPFKRYPPGFDNFYGSQRNLEFKLQEHYSSFVQISYFVFLSMPWSFSFLRKFSYSSSTFALFTACVSIQIGIIMMQLVDRIHCMFLEQLLKKPDFDIDKAMLTRLNMNDFQYRCQIQRPLDEVEDGFGLRQLRQACYCLEWKEMAKNVTRREQMPLVAAHALLVTGKRNFDDNSFSMSFMDIVDGLYSTVPTLISFAVMVGKMAPIQNVVLAIMNVMAYAFNYWVNVYVMGTFDGTGGAVTTHIFGAFFGMACTAVATPRGAAHDPDCKGRYQSDIFSLFGSLMIWAYYPSYNSFYAPPAAQQAVAINTYLSLLGSSIAGLSASAVFSGNLKLNIFDAQRSSIAGGVAMGSVANLVAKPWHATLIGACGGVMCSFAGHFMRVFCDDRLEVHDTVGVMSMHGWPGLVGWFAGVIYLLPLTQDTLSGDLQSADLAYKLEWDMILQNRRGEGDAAYVQLMSAPMTISIAMVTGLIAGLVAKKITVLDRRLLFKDSTFFDVPEDFHDLNADVSDEEEQGGAEPANGGNSKLEIAV